MTCLIALYLRSPEAANLAGEFVFGVSTTLKGGLTVTCPAGVVLKNVEAKKTSCACPVGMRGRKASSRDVQGMCRSYRKGGFPVKEETCKKVFGVREKGLRHTLLKNACKLGYPGLKSRVAGDRKLAASKEREKQMAEHWRPMKRIEGRWMDQGFHSNGDWMLACGRHRCMRAIYKVCEGEKLWRSGA